MSWGTPGKTAQCVTRAKPAQDWRGGLQSCLSPAAAQTGIWGITCKSPPYEDGVRIQRMRGPNQAGYQQIGSQHGSQKSKGLEKSRKHLSQPRTILVSLEITLHITCPGLSKDCSDRNRLWRLGNFLSLQTQLNFYSCFQRSFCCFFHSFCWTVALGKALILCAKCIR